MKIVPELKPIGVGQFAGVLDYSKMPALMRPLFKGAMAVMKVKEGDYVIGRMTWRKVQIKIHNRYLLLVKSKSMSFSSRERECHIPWVKYIFH